MTGVNFFAREVNSKRLAILHELVPKAVRIAVLVNPGNPTIAEATLRDVQEGARVVGLQVLVLKASTTREIDVAFATFSRKRPDALFVGPDAFFSSRRVQFATLAAHHRIPAAYSLRDHVAAGGLMSYGQCCRFVPSDRRLHRPNSQGGEAGRPPSAAGHEP